ncbi:MAG: hypothetical protein PUH02_00485 [bacterium]|nr:hypothetical protein [bacterium]
MDKVIVLRIGNLSERGKKAADARGFFSGKMVNKVKKEKNPCYFSCIFHNSIV